MSETRRLEDTPSNGFAKPGTVSTSKDETSINIARMDTRIPENDSVTRRDNDKVERARWLVNKIFGVDLL